MPENLTPCDRDTSLPLFKILFIILLLLFHFTLVFCEKLIQALFLLVEITRIFSITVSFVESCPASLMEGIPLQGTCVVLF